MQAQSRTPFFHCSLNNICIECLDNMLKQLPVITCYATSNNLSAEVSTACRPNPQSRQGKVWLLLHMAKYMFCCKTSMVLWSRTTQTCKSSWSSSLWTHQMTVTVCSCRKAALQDIIVTGMDLHSLNTCLPLGSVTFSPDQLPVRGPVLACQHTYSKGHSHHDAWLMRVTVWPFSLHSIGPFVVSSELRIVATTGHESGFRTLVAFTCLKCRQINNTQKLGSTTFFYF